MAAATDRVLSVKDHRERATDVRRWDPKSPQKLVRIDGRLYQKDAGLYFAVIPGRITVRLGDAVEDWDDLVRRAVKQAPGFEKLEQLSPIRVNRLGVVRLSIPDGTDQAAWCELVHRTGLARYAEVATYGVFEAMANDPMYMNQWALNNTGQNNGTPGSDVDAESAWDVTSGDSSIVVAVLDSGTDIDHEDLAANVWHNDDEIPGNSLDDDNNGYVDDWEGWDFHNMNNEPRPVHYHGTHVTGIINAVGNNGIGIAGLAGGLGSPGVLGMALGVGDEAENGDVIDEAVLYAADNGAHVITFALKTAETQAINDALDYAYFTKDLFIDCSAGNDNAEVGYPARHPAVMAVGSTGNDDTKSSFSNVGPEIEISAPGENIVSTRPNDAYSSGSGTSFAAPHVAAVAGLVRGLNPDLTAVDVRTVIIESADDIEAPGYDVRTGHGRLNAARAVRLASTSDGIVRFSDDVYVCDGSIGLLVVDADISGAGSVSVTVSSDTEPGGESVLLSESNPGSGLYRGSIDSAYEAAVSDGTLQVQDGDSLLVEYVDLDDGMGGTSLIKTHSATIDCVAPAISDVRAEEISEDSATVSWTTNEGATSTVTHGVAVPPLDLSSDPNSVVDHSIDLADLAACTVYYFSVSSTDAAGNVGSDDNAGAFHHFETLIDFGQGPQPCHQGRVSFDVATVGCSSSLPVSLGDQDLNTDPGLVETVSVTLTSTTESIPETLVLTETGTDSSIFTGSIATGTGIAMPSDAILQVAHGDILTATYRDADDGSGSPAVTFDLAVTDCAGPQATQVLVRDISDHDAVVEWSAAEPFTGAVEWGPTAALGNVASTGALATTQSVVIGDFPECGRVYFRLISTDAAGNTSIADAAGQPFEFDAFTLNGIVHEDGFETDLGWTLEGEWELDVPLGLGSAPGDPAAANDGSRVLGHDLTGLGNAPGDYEINRTRSAISPVLDLSALSSVELRFDRWLNVESSGRSSVEVKDSGGVWQSVWSTTSNSDTSWSEQFFDVTAFAAGNATTQIRFLQFSRFATAAGWNVDRLILRDSALATYATCAACSGDPSFAGAVAATDDDPCADSGVTVTWSQAPAWGSGTGGTYAVYRDTVDGFIPGPGNLVAGGVAGTMWVDLAAPTGMPLYYVVRAENNESCGVGPGNGGLTDSNSIQVATINETSQPVPGDVGNTLALSPSNGVHVRLQWAAAVNAVGYRVYRSDLPDGTAELIAAPTGAPFEDLGALNGSGVSYYTVLATDACGNESSD